MTLVKDRIVLAAGRFFQSLAIGNESQPADLPESTENTEQIVHRK